MKKSCSLSKNVIFYDFLRFFHFFFKSSKIYLFFTPIWSCYTFLERYLPGDWYKIIENHVKLYFHAQIFEESWKIESFFNYFVRQKFVNQNKNFKKNLTFSKRGLSPISKTVFNSFIALWTPKIWTGKVALKIFFFCKLLLCVCTVRGNTQQRKHDI